MKTHPLRQVIAVAFIAALFLAGPWIRDIAAKPIPKLVIKKGVVATNNPNAKFAPPLSPAGKWKPFGSSCPRFNGIITSGNLAGLIHSNLNGVAAGNRVTFAIAIQNAGTAPAYDVEVIETMPLDQVDRPACFEVLTNFCVRRGNGTPLPFTTALAGHGRTRIKLGGGPLAPGFPSNPTGTNIAIITFNAQLVSNLHLECCENKAEVAHYAATPNGPDLVAGSSSLAYHDSARLCRSPYPPKRQ
ncbi:MAG TPA: hypothetical protein VK581_02790 [Chthoniobacterales bacterium]|nr:hypothetical protein [Chthoniobacterales bacterium]